MNGDIKSLNLPKWEEKQFFIWLVEACEEYFKDPKVVERFNKWKTERDAQNNNSI